MSGLAKSIRDVVLKFEPFVLHVQCRRLEDAQLMVRRTVYVTVYIVEQSKCCFMHSVKGEEVNTTHSSNLLVGMSLARCTS